MDNRPAETVSRDLDALFRLGVVAALSDEQLLERFAAHTESDSEIAFEAIVSRHGPMVMGVCRRLSVEVAECGDLFVGANGLLVHDFGVVQPVLAPFDRAAELSVVKPASGRE